MDSGRLSARFRLLRERLRESAEDAVLLARLTRDLPWHLRHPVTINEARTVVPTHLATREQRFLTIVDRAIFARPGTPFWMLLRHAGCEPGDVQALVAREGLEGALRILADRGVYLSFEESKGRSEIVRGSLRFTIREHELDNPLSAPQLLLTTSGSAGRPTRVRHSLAYLREHAAGYALVLDMLGLHRPRMACWWPVPLYHAVLDAMLGLPMEAWWYPVHPLPKRVRLIARYLRLLGQTAGLPFPLPRRCDLTEPQQMVDWLAAQVTPDRPIVLLTMPSAAARIGIAAAESGRSLDGVIFHIGGEPVTDARRRHIESSGARPFVVYGSVEHGGLASGCGHPRASDDVHVMLDRLAVVTRSRPAPGGGPIVQSTLLTALSPHTAKIALNVELGDSARVEDRECGCALGALGFRTHLSEIRSFEKLTGEGVTFARSNLEQILEEVLPARFGGASIDYQLAEQEAPTGETRLVLRVRPSVGEVDEAALRDALLHELRRGGTADQYQSEIWRNAGTVEVRREAPIPTRAGKVLPFQLLRHAERVGAADTNNV